jgi:hypothetical protein
MARHARTLRAVLTRSFLPEGRDKHDDEDHEHQPEYKAEDRMALLLSASAAGFHLPEFARGRRSSGFGYGYSSRGPAHPDDALAAPKKARRTERLLKKFADYPDEKKLPGPDADAVLWAVAERVEEETDLEELELPGVPEWAGLYGDTSEWDGWSVGLVRECLAMMASAADENLEELMEGAREKARLDVISAKQEAERVEIELSNMRRERLLPDEKTLEKVSRYEAHLSRLMFKALHELEALQVRRSGGAAPLARLDVDGFPQE